MAKTVISVEHLSKCYRLGVIGTGTAFGDLKRWWAKKRGKPDPYLKIGSADHGNREGETVWALKDINFTVEQGDTLGIIGRNGAGKSTLLKILSQVTAPTEGVVKVKGRIASLLEVGTGFHGELTGRENIYLNGAINGLSRAEVKRKLDEIIDFSGVEKYIDTPVKRYSSGMYVRLAFAVAAHLDPDILVVDEVLAVGDLTFQKKCIGKMGDVAREGRTVLFVSHNLGVVSSFTQTCLYLERGMIIDMGDTQPVIQNYTTMLSEQVSVDGWVDFADAKHNVAGDRELAKLDWARTCNTMANQTWTFFENEPIRLEVGFSLKQPVNYLELAASVRSLNNSPLFIMPSGQYNNLLTGKYSISIVIDPIYLQAGIYSFGLYLFVGGQKEDVIFPALQINVISTPNQKNNPFHQKWGEGYFLRFNYKWNVLQQSGE